MNILPLFPCVLIAREKFCHYWLLISNKKNERMILPFMEEYSPMYLTLYSTCKKRHFHEKKYDLISNIIPTFTLPNGA